MQIKGIGITCFLAWICFQDTEFPPDRGVNPYLSQVKAPSGHLTRTGGFRLSNTLQAHALSISG